LSQSTLPDSTSATSSPGSEAGPSPCGGPDSKALPGSGPGHVRVSRFRALVKDRDTPMSATFGPLFTASSPSAVLQRSLESKLRQKMDVNGSPEFVLTWKTWDMPAGEPICALRASERRTGDKGCSGWPTPIVSDTRHSGFSEHSKHDKLVYVAQLATWPTPTTQRQVEPEKADRENAKGNWQGVTGLVGWATPCAQGDSTGGGCLGDAMKKAAGLKRPSGASYGTKLNEQVLLAIGPDATSCPAGTGKRGVLNPNHSRWLMGYPLTWTLCGMLAFLKTKSARRSARSRSLSMPSGARCFSGAWETR